MVNKNDIFMADMHCHSSCSDGAFDAINLINIAKTKNLMGFSITDHDTIQCYDEKLFLYAKSLGITLIPGVEISSLCGDRRLHILGYSFSLYNDDFQSFLKKQRAARRKRAIKIVNNLRSLGMKISINDVTCDVKNTCVDKENVLIGRPNIAFTMMRLGYVSTIKEAFYKYLKDGGSCYEEGEYGASIECIEAIHNAGGLAVIAHPHLIDDKQLVKDMLKLPFDGIEVFYGVKPMRSCMIWKSIAIKHKLLITGGSDFHGIFDDDKRNLEIGSSWIGAREFSLIQSSNTYQLSTK